MHIQVRILTVCAGHGFQRDTILSGTDTLSCHQYQQMDSAITYITEAITKVKLQRPGITH